MQYKNLMLLGLTGFTIAQNDSDCDSPDSNTDEGGNNCSTRVATSTDSNGNGIVYTTRATDVEASTSFRPVTTGVVVSNTDVNTMISRLTETTDIGTTPTNTVVQFATTTDVNLQSGFAYTTDSSGHTIATFTGTGTAPKLTQSGAAGANARSSSMTSSDSSAMATAAPYMAAAVGMGALAFAI